MKCSLMSDDTVKNVLSGKVLVSCPRSKEDVNVRKKCARCDYFKHITWNGLQPLIGCDYDKFEKESEKGPGGLKRW